MHPWLLFTKQGELPGSTWKNEIPGGSIQQKVAKMQEECIFCKIIGKEIPTEMLYEDDEIVAFNDINPKAKHHVLILPKKHIPTIKDLNETEQDELLVGKLVLVARDIAKERGLEGYNLQFNVGESAGQIIFHIHLHLISNG